MSDSAIWCSAMLFIPLALFCLRLTLHTTCLHISDCLEHVIGQSKLVTWLETECHAYSSLRVSFPEQVEVHAEAGAGLVKITSNANGEVKSLEIDPSILVASEKEVVEDL